MVVNLFRMTIIPCRSTSQFPCEQPPLQKCKYSWLGAQRLTRRLKLCQVEPKIRLPMIQLQKAKWQIIEEHDGGKHIQMMRGSSSGKERKMERSKKMGDMSI